MNKDPFKEYIKESEPDKRDKGYAWHTAIGLQAVDGLKTSEYLVQTAVRNIEGEISFEEANALLQSYYEENPARDADDRTEEADKVSARIAALLSEKAFSFTPNEYISIHRKLFTGIYFHAGHIRNYNITKKEWVLDGATLVRANYNDLKNGVHETTEFLELFLRNFLLNESNPLHNRTLHISGTFKEAGKPDIEALKPDIEKSFQPKTESHILKLREAFPGQTVFGRSDVMKVIDIKSSRASDLLKEMAEHRIIEPVSGHGKGKYRFRHQES